MAKKKAANLLPKLTETEQDLLSHIQHGYQLEADLLVAPVGWSTFAGRQRDSDTAVAILFPST
jgi:hypothetical protein